MRKKRKEKEKSSFIPYVCLLLLFCRRRNLQLQFCPKETLVSKSGLTKGWPQSCDFYSRSTGFVAMSTGSAPVPIDISSDEDELTDWIDELLDGKDELDDIVLLDEFWDSVEIPDEEEEEEEEERSKRMVDSDDGDCVVLDFDPDKPVEVKVDDGDGSDDLVVVGDKGEIACRDFPHSRHLCASYPFSTTFHEKHCSLCHCYVCDSLAPCVYWGNGASFTDHCHATDKNEMWKKQRKSYKATNTVTLPRERPDDATLRMISPPIRNSAPIQRSVSVSRPTQPSTLNPVRPCSASIVATPYALGQKHHQRPPVISSHSQNLSQQSSRSLPSTTGTQCVQKEGHGAGANSILQSSHTIFKRTGTPGSGLISSSINCPQYRPSTVNQQPMPQKPHYPRPVQVLRSFPQAVTSHNTHVTMVTPQLSQQTTITSQRSQLSTMSQQTPVTSQRSHPSSAPQRTPVTSHRSQLSSTSQRMPVTSQRSQLSTMSQRTPVTSQRSHPSSAPQRMPVASHRSQLSSTSQRMPVTSQRPQLSSTRQIPPFMPVPSRTPQLTDSQRPQRMPVTSQRPQLSSTRQIPPCMPVPSRTPQLTPVVQLEDSVKKLQGILGSVSSEFDVSGSVLTSIQPYQPSSQCPSVGNQIPSQEMGYRHAGPLTTSPDHVDFVCSWLDRTAGENFTEAGEPVAQPSEPVVPLWNTAPEVSSIESLLSSVQQEAVLVVGKEVGLPDKPSLPLDDFGGTTW